MLTVRLTHTGPAPEPFVRDRWAVWERLKANGEYATRSTAEQLVGR